MTLSFQTKWPERMGELTGQKNYFVEKILKGLPDNDKDFYPEICVHCGWEGMSSIHLSERCSKCGYFSLRYYREFPPLGDNGCYTHLNVHAKIHTIRHDPHNRWKPGMKIHFVINNRTKNVFQFAPVIECMSVQKIEIVYRHIKNERPANVWIDDRIMSEDEVLQLALNDGFPSVEAFFLYFNEDFSGKIIHFTDLKY